MPPKCRFTEDEILSCALDIVRGDGMAALTAREVAKRLSASTKVIFYYFPDMETLRARGTEAADALYQRRIAEEMAAGEYPPYKASGMAYIRFAREEKALFRLLFMRDRSKEDTRANEGDLSPFVRIIRENTGVSEEKAFFMHLEMWVYVHGIATMIVTGYLNWDMETVSGMLTDIYGGICARFAKGGEQQNGSDSDA